MDKKRKESSFIILEPDKKSAKKIQSLEEKNFSYV